MDNIQKKGYVLEFGHLSRDKGTDTLLEVAKRMWNKFLRNPLHIVKDYELRKLLWQSGGAQRSAKNI